MRLPFGLEITRRMAATGTDAPRVSLPAVRSSSSSYSNPLGIGNDIPTTVDLSVYDGLVSAVPFLDVALRKLSRMIAPFEVTSDDENTAAALNAWLKTCTVNDVFTGFSSFSTPYIRQMLQYGKTAGEIALTKTGREVACLYPIAASKIRLIRTPTGVVVGEQTNFGQVTAYPDQSLIIYSTCGKEGDELQGTSLLRSIPWVANIVLRMEDSIRQKWQRHGAPSFVVAWNAPATVSIPQDMLDAARDQIKSDWLKAMNARRNGEGIMDFFAAVQGEIAADPVDSNGELDFQTPYRAFTEQIVSTVELAPFMLGLQWSTTERLSQQQADAIIGCVDDMRTELEPDFLHVLGWVARLGGLRGSIGIDWADVNLQDMVNTAQGDVLQAQAQKLRTENALSAWRNGWTDQVGAKDLAGYDDPDIIAIPLDAPVASPAGPGAFSGYDGMADALWQRYP